MDGAITEMANFLAIESTASLCSIALGFNGNVTVREQEGARSHTQFMLPLIDEVLQVEHCDIASLDAIAFAAGPGAFTGVRLAASVAKALAFAAGIPVIPVSSLAVIAQTTARLTGSVAPCLVITDARMGEVYIAEYAFDEQGIAYAVQEDALLAVGRLDLQAFSAKRIAGDAAALLANHAGIDGFTLVNTVAQAQDLLLLAEHAWQHQRVETALSAQAIYLRDKTSWKTVEQQNRERENK
jgi:tRNA threonylcarbamoyladenosine biosynthesis protein TsaB